ncbi:MAG: peptidylprolyl isomerase [Deltaproteobacteria bacterium]|nr:peptidylprolyl isomerase [Deltaproteobacteria bacterium]
MNRKAVWALACALFVQVSLIGGGWCSDNSKESTQGLAAMVNGKPITVAALEKNLVIAQKRYEAMKKRLTDQERKELRSTVLNTMIEEILLDEVADREGVRVDDAEVDSVIETFKGKYPTEAAFQKAVSDAGSSLDELRQNIRRGKRIKKLLDNRFELKPGEAETMAQSYYESHPDEFVQEESYKVGNILIRKSEKADTSVQEEARKKAEKALSRIKAGENFADVAKEVSEGPRAKEGGDLGYITKGRMVPEFEAVAFSLKQGEVSDIVETRFGYQIIKVYDIRKGKRVPFDKIKVSLTRRMEQDFGREKTNEYVSSLREKAKIEVFQ